MTLRLDPVLDLGRDSERMTPKDKQRQEATVNALLQAFTGPESGRRELQLLADEVGLGKTFVALATAYSLLRFLRSQPDGAANLGLNKCYRAIVVVTPTGNKALAKKWYQEVEALRTRCSTARGKTDWFCAKYCENAYDLVEGLRRAHDLRRKADENPCILICTANVFRLKVRDADTRLRFLAACLFRWWGNKLTQYERYRIVSRAAEVRGFSSWAECARRLGAGTYEVNLWNFREHEQYLAANERMRSEWFGNLDVQYQQAPFAYEEIVNALEQFAVTDEGKGLLFDGTERTRAGEQEPAGLLPYCRHAAERRGYADWYFDGFKGRLLALYKGLAPFLIRQDLPLVIVDEAHHWRNNARQDCQDFCANLAPRCRRLLLLTATPFQLRQDELLEVLSVGDAMAPAIGEDRVSHLRRLREGLTQAMESSEEKGKGFSREWGALADQLARLDSRLDPAHGWLPGELDPRTEEIGRWWDELRKVPEEGFRDGLSHIPGHLRPFFNRALELKESNARLQVAMRRLIIRHRREVAHRRVWVGREYPPSSPEAKRPDQHLLHLAPGAAVPAHAELAQYLLMKVVSEASRGRHRTALGMDLTGCYSTLWQSKEGVRATEAALSGDSPRLLRLLHQVTGYHPSGESSEDAHHPKVQLVVEEVLSRWDRGEKSVILCFRIPTAGTLARLLSRGVEERLKKARRSLLLARGTVIKDRSDEDTAEDTAMNQFRRALTARDGGGVPLFLDRVLLGWFQQYRLQLPVLTEEDKRQIARLYAQAQHQGAPLLKTGDRTRKLDRVFLNRALEHVWANRLLLPDMEWASGNDPSAVGDTKGLLEIMADPAWVRYRYAREDLSRRARGGSDEGAGPTDTIARSSLAATYSLDQAPNPTAEKTVIEALNTTPTGRRLSVAATLVSGPNLFVPLGDETIPFLDEAARKRVRGMFRLLLAMTFSSTKWDWEQRANVLDAVVRALLREDILLRLPRRVFEDDDETWAASILRGLHEPPESGQRESLAERVEEFLRELTEMGDIERKNHISYALNARAEAVVLVTGSTKVDRNAVFSGFNTPLLPDILVCSEVGQEGIDLHRHCRHVVHYDLGWNPATIEQRTGRTDRIGSKALRERRLETDSRQQQGKEFRDADLPGLDVALPYLAGTYDERMFDRLRSRAQVFEILTGGDPTADRSQEASWLNPDDEGQADGMDYVLLPTGMLEDLRVNLGVL